MKMIAMKMRTVRGWYYKRNDSWERQKAEEKIDTQPDTRRFEERKIPCVLQARACTFTQLLCTRIDLSFDTNLD